MSPHAMNTFVSDLVEMAKAVERLPAVEYELELANATIQDYANKVQDRELAILRYKEDIATLQAKLQTTEAERDDSELRFLEAEDKLARMVNLVRVSAADLGLVVTDKPLPEPTPEPYSEPQPETIIAPYAPADWGISASEGQHVDGSAEGQSVVDPTAQEPITTSSSVDPIPTLDLPADPEPTDRWSAEWYDWKDRQRANGTF